MLAEHAAESVSEASERRYASNSDMAPQAVPKHAKTESASNASAPRSVRWMSPDLACSAAASSVRCAARVCSSVSNEAKPCVASTEVRTSNGSVRAISNRAFVCATVALPTMTCGTDRCLPNWPGRRAVDAMAPKVASTRTATARICRGFIGASSSLELVTRPRATVCQILSLNTARVTYETCAKTCLFPAPLNTPQSPLWLAWRGSQGRGWLPNRYHIRSHMPLFHLSPVVSVKLKHVWRKPGSSLLYFRRRIP